MLKKYKSYLLLLIGYIIYRVTTEETVTFTMILMIILSFAFIAWMLEELDKQNAN
ncbi:hypothetical protein RYX45_05660 [Alkalihalophilus pseudofirmus]|uniref:Uncharacterized protein n=1 Tax=Alkalihalophilus pseudofirmus TaxID=79885 RepID=A0AAJ2L129_ALKPS|nr:hypothetical protein [Alkalihalophilus pseudofirmus]MDV2884655.1 hypothetical protein [Alkalihalophilus pseudofirmus]WEG18910.1 hypothetical protein PQ478_10600 [Alkalihalophilus pseudofirmus]